MAKVMVKSVRTAFPAIFKPAAVGDGEPAYGSKFPIDPKNKAQVAELDKAMLDAATEKWGAKGKQILDKLIEEGKVAFVHKEYCNKDGDPYDGFGGMFSLSTRNPKLKPTALNRDLSPVTEADGVIYGGCYVDASVEFWAQDNTFGRRLNCNLRGVKFVKDGDAFGGASPAKADEFTASDEEESDFA